MREVPRKIVAISSNLRCGLGRGVGLEPQRNRLRNLNSKFYDSRRPVPKELEANSILTVGTLSPVALYAALDDSGPSLDEAKNLAEVTWQILRRDPPAAGLRGDPRHRLTVYRRSAGTHSQQTFGCRSRACSLQHRPGFGQIEYYRLGFASLECFWVEEPIFMPFLLGFLQHAQVFLLSFPTRRIVVIPLYLLTAGHDESVPVELLQGAKGIVGILVGVVILLSRHCST